MFINNLRKLKNGISNYTNNKATVPGSKLGKDVCTYVCTYVYTYLLDAVKSVPCIE